MEDSHRRPHLESGNFHVQGMETVVATVSGYHGSERFNLIRLISRTGASYVGNMNSCTTHLVCWKFEGKKYELAKKLKIATVNHRWIEECLRKGRRVSEEPYSFQCGEEMGLLHLNYLSGINVAKGKSQLVKRHKEPVIDIECEDVYNDDWTDPILFSQPKHGSHGSKKSIRKSIKWSSSKDHFTSSNRCLESFSRQTTVELEEAGTSAHTDSYRLRKRTITSLEHDSKVRRLVKKHTNLEDLTLDDCEEVETLLCSSGSGILPDNAPVVRHQNSSSRNASDTRRSLSGQDNADAHRAEENVNCENQNACFPGILSSVPTDAEEFEEDANETFVDNNPVNRLPASSELSCVICWTDFSSIRGVLPCGHRFCFSCIQNWADHMVSRKKSSTCPLCKASFICITKVDAIPSDQKIYSQTIPSHGSNTDLYLLPDETHGPPSNPLHATCCRCFSREPEDLLIRCNFCQTRCIHSYCLDPLLLPWTCVHCKDLQILYLHSR